MKYLVSLFVSAAVVAAGVGYVPGESEAATNFLIRGDLVKIDKTNSNFHVYIRHANSAADNFAGEIHEVNAKGATFYKYDSKQRKVKSTFGTTLTNLGQEVVVKGTIDSSNSFRATWVVRNDNTVKMTGYVRGQDTANNYLEVETEKLQFQATGKDYKATTYPKSTKIKVFYDEDSTKFLSRDGNTMNEDEFSNNDEKITLDNIEVRNSTRFEADVRSTITDGKWLF